MLDSQITKIDAQLKQALGAKELFVLGRETGFEKTGAPHHDAAVRDESSAVAGKPTSRIDCRPASELQPATPHHENSRSPDDG